jgi:predicted nucleic acid-binding protein
LIVVDTSAWVEFLRRTESRVDLHLTRLLGERAEVAVTEVVVLELLAGANQPARRDRVQEMLLGLPVLQLGGLAGYERAAEIYRECRSAGSTVRTLLDCLVAVPAIEADAAVLHADRDFDVLARHTALRVVKLDE